MASLSIARRRQAWLDGVVCGATGKGHSELKVPKLKEIYERGVQFGSANAEAPTVKAMVASKARPHAPPKPATRPNDRYRSRQAPRGNSAPPRRFDRPERRGF